MESIISNCLETEKTHTYVGIGSCPHAHTLEEFVPRLDQLLPLFLDPILESNPESSLLVVHFDPLFAKRKDFLDLYFGSAYVTTRFGPLLHFSSSGYFVWMNNRIQILVSPLHFYTGSQDQQQTKENHRWFLELLVDDAIQMNTKLIVQDYTGYEMESVFRFLYQNSHPPRAFLDRVLFDVSYGCDSGCMTDLSKYAPLYTTRGNFINLLLLTPREIIDVMNTCTEKSRILAFVQRLYFRIFRTCVNTIHPDFRRRRVGDPVFSTEYSYRNDSSPETVMRVLQEEIESILPILRSVQLLSHENGLKLHRLFQTYSTMDPYKWYAEFYNLVELPPEKIESSIA